MTAGCTRIATVARKEVVDTLRDRRTALVTLLPALLGPAFLVLMLYVVAAQSGKSRDLVLPVAGAEHAPALIAFLVRQQVVVRSAPADFEARVRDGDLDVVLDVDAKFADDVALGRPGIVRVVYDRSRDRARASIEQTEILLRALQPRMGTRAAPAARRLARRRESARRRSRTTLRRRRARVRSCSSSSPTTGCSPR